MKTTKIKGETKLERNVANWLNERVSDYEGGMQAVIEELLQHGCVSGLVGHLIYYSDTCAFYSRNKAEINGLLKEALQSTGYKSPLNCLGINGIQKIRLPMKTRTKTCLHGLGLKKRLESLERKQELNFNPSHTLILKDGVFDLHELLP